MIHQILRTFTAIELSNEKWKLGFTIGFGQTPRERDLEARDLAGLVKEIRMAKERFGLPEDASVLSCYEAGRDSFWLHRYLQTQGIANLVVDSASIEVNRRKRRAKTDRRDDERERSATIPPSFAYTCGAGTGVSGRFACNSAAGTSGSTEQGTTGGRDLRRSTRPYLGVLAFD